LFRKGDWAEKVKTTGYFLGVLHSSPNEAEFFGNSPGSSVPGPFIAKSWFVARATTDAKPDPAGSPHLLHRGSGKELCAAATPGNGQAR
jgi:hypothetical protein